VRSPSPHLRRALPRARLRCPLPRTASPLPCSPAYSICRIEVQEKMGYFSSSGSWMCSGVARSSALLIDRSSQDQRGAPIVAGEDLLLDLGEGMDEDRPQLVDSHDLLGGSGQGARVYRQR
jgi:hypothetical protein